MMKYLIVSDIHGSLPALEQVLAFYREQQCGMLCILGDILNYGPRNGIPQGLDPKGIAEGSIVFFMVTPTGGNLNGLSIQRSAIPAPSLSRRTGTCQHSLFTVTVRYPFTGWTAAGSRNFLSDGECIITAYYNCSLL